MKNNLIIPAFLILIFFIISCAPQRIKLNNEELRIEKQLQTELHCPELEMRHDYDAITEKRNDGSFEVLLCDRFCSMDSLEIKEIVLKITSKITPILNYKSNYQKIAFYTSKEKHLSEKTSRLVCSKIVEILIKDPNNVYINK